MSEQMMPANGSFCWNELSTTDDEAAIKFYTELLGWGVQGGPPRECEGSEAPPMVYTEIVVAGRHVGGIYKMGPEQSGEPSNWRPYVAVDDVDAMGAQVAKGGGRVCV